MKMLRPALVVTALLAAPAFAAATEIQFSGISWTVKTGSAGPGPNLWSDSPQSVWVDAQGRLHLKIRRQKGKWYCAEVVSTTGFGHGNYRFELSTDVEALDPNAVLGMFTYLDDDHEVDVEMSRFGDPAQPTGHFVVQPYYRPGNQQLFDLGLQGTHSTHRFRWLPDRVEFQSLHGHYETPPTPDSVIQDWICASPDVPAAGGERLHLNLWLFRGAAPTDKREVEVGIDRVVVDPPLHLDATGAPAGTVALAVDGGFAGDPVVLSAGPTAPTDPVLTGPFDASGAFAGEWVPDPALSGTTLVFGATSWHAYGVSLASNAVTLILP